MFGKVGFILILSLGSFAGSAENPPAVKLNGIEPKSNQKCDRSLIQGLNLEIKKTGCLSANNSKCVAQFASQALDSVSDKVGQAMGLAGLATLTAMNKAEPATANQVLAKLRSQGGKNRYMKNWIRFRSQKIGPLQSRATRFVEKHSGKFMVLTLGLMAYDQFLRPETEEKPESDPRCRSHSAARIPAVYDEESLQCSPLLSLQTSEVVEFLAQTPERQEFELKTNPNTCAFYNAILAEQVKENQEAIDQLKKTKLASIPKCTSGGVEFTALGTGAGGYRGLSFSFAANVQEDGEMKSLRVKELSSLGRNDVVVNFAGETGTANYRMPAGEKMLTRMTQSLDNFTEGSALAGRAGDALGKSMGLVPLLNECCKQDDSNQCFQQNFNFESGPAPRAESAARR